MSEDKKPSRPKVAAIAAAISALATMLIEALAVSQPLLTLIFG